MEATTIITTGFLVYTLILLGILIWLVKSIKEDKKNRRILYKEGILTQAKIRNISHPEKKKLVIEYEHEITNFRTETIIGTIEIDLKFKNEEIQKSHYSVGSMIDMLYLKENPTIASLATDVSPSNSPVGENNLKLSINIIALASALLMLFMVSSGDLPDDVNTIEASVNTLFIFLLYLFFLALSVIFVFATFFHAQKFFRLRRGIKEIGEVLNTWKIIEDKGRSRYHVKYTYPAIAPFSLETTISGRLYNQMMKSNLIEVYYLEKDKFLSKITGNTKPTVAFIIFSILSFLMFIFTKAVFFGFLLEPFL